MRPLFLLLLLANCQSPAAPLPSPCSTLRECASRAGVFYGSAIHPAALDHDAEYRALLATHVGSVTDEWGTKWESVQPEPGRFDFRYADRIVGFAESLGVPVRGHALLWHHALPQWARDTIAAGGAEAMLRSHAQALMGRYRGRIARWDVANEPFLDDGSWRQTPWKLALGPDYLATAFRIAHEADPAARLVLNEYGLHYSSKKLQAVVSEVARLRSAGVPVHGVGLQGHLELASAPSEEEWVRILGAVASTGADVEITELDVRLPTQPSPGELEAQAEAFRAVAAACLRVPACMGITTWGMTDRYSWIPTGFPELDHGLLFGKELEPKAGYHALLAAFQDRPRRATRAAGFP